MSKERSKTAFQRQIAVTAGLVAVVIALAIGYCIFAPRLAQKPNDGGNGIVLLPGEAQAVGNSIYLYDRITSDSVETIEVSNKKGSYSVHRSHNSTNSTGFYVNNNDDAPYDSAMFAALVVSTGTVISSTRVIPAPQEATEPAVIEYATFGLDEEHRNARFTITATDGTTHTVYIGAAVSDGTGYYACLEGRNAVYILNNDLESTVLGTAQSIISPQLFYPISTDDYQTIDNFTLWHNGEHMLTIHYLSTKSEVEEYAATSNYLMTCAQEISAADAVRADTSQKQQALFGIDRLPYEYTPVIDAYSNLLASFPTFEGDETVAVRENGDGISAQQLADFHINPVTPAHELFFNYNGIMNYVIFSEKNADGYFYAYSYLYDLIVKVSADKVAFLEWSFPQWVEPAFFQKNIINIKNITLKSAQADLSFDLVSEKNDKGKYNLTVREHGKLIDSANFRQFYRVLLTRKIRDGYTDPPPTEDSLYLTVTVTTTADVTTVYRFYRIDTQRMYLTVNGDGEFYILSSVVKKLESDAIKAAENQPVDAYDRR